MRTVFVTIYDGDTEKIILHSGIVERLAAAGCRVVVCIRGADRRSYYEETYANKNVRIEVLPPSRSFVEKIWHEINWNSVPVHFVNVRHRIAYARSRKLLPYLFRTLIWRLSYSHAWRAFLRFVYSAVKDDYAASLFDMYMPDVVFAPNMFSPSDFRMLRAAKQRGIKTVTMGKSWDVFTTKAFTRVQADKIIAFNEHIAEEAVRYGDYDHRAVVVTGFPQYDQSPGYTPRVSREEFCAALGLDPQKKIILFALQGDWIAPKTCEVLEGLDKSITDGALGVPVQILARLHPKYRDASEKIVLANGVFDRPGTLLGDSTHIVASGGHLFSWTFTAKDIAHLLDSIYFADVAVLTVSTMLLDTLAMDRPLVLVGYDGESKVPHYESIMRQYEREYYQHAMSFGGTPLAKNKKELVSELRSFLSDKNHLRGERDLAREHLLYKNDGQAAKRLAEAILDTI